MWVDVHSSSVLLITIVIVRIAPSYLSFGRGVNADNPPISADCASPITLDFVIAPFIPVLPDKIEIQTEMVSVSISPYR